MNTNHNIIPLNHSDLNEISTLLHDENLPTEDLKTAGINFYGIRNNNRLIASGALQIYGTNAILRSVAVAKEFKQQGLGKQLTKFLEDTARTNGINQLFLLTTTAADYFQGRGYLSIERSDCPKEIQLSAEFSSLCPSTAKCLFKKL